MVDHRDIVRLAAEVETQGKRREPPVESWNPDFSGDIDIRIDREGRWFHEGGLFGRQSLVNLFSSILKKENDEYFLVTPVEKWRIQVDEEPFVFIDMNWEHTEDGQSSLELMTNTGDKIVVGASHPFRLSVAESGDPRPAVLVRRNLWGLINRSVFYQLVDDVMARSETPPFSFNSAGVRFELPLE